MTMYTDDSWVVVGVGEIAVAEHPLLLVTQALGSCVGVALWDSNRKAGGMAHVMLPTPGCTAAEGHTDRFASCAIPRLVSLLEAAGSPRRRLVAKIAGGAAMFGTDTVLSSVGERNISEVRVQLRQAGIAIRAEDTGGRHARTIEQHLDTGILLVRSYVYGIREL
jgi:chemotaxis protein CheD